MKRTILFRGQKVGKKEWAYGYLADSCYGFSILTEKLYHVDGAEWSVTQEEIIPESVGQFTGLTDKNSTKVFEGDILEFQDKWEWYRHSWWAKLAFASESERIELKKEYDALPTEKRVVEYDIEEGYNFSVSDLKSGYFVVIGNIYDNPELLK